VKAARLAASASGKCQNLAKKDRTPDFRYIEGTSLRGRCAERQAQDAPFFGQLPQLSVAE
jgi:hypothetical protein